MGSTTRITYKTRNFEVRALDEEQLTLMAQMRVKADAAFAAGRPVMGVYVSDLDLDVPEFKVCLGEDYDMMRTMVQGHLQVANVVSLAH